MLTCLLRRSKKSGHGLHELLLIKDLDFIRFLHLSFFVPTHVNFCSLSKPSLVICEALRIRWKGFRIIAIIGKEVDTITYEGTVKISRCFDIAQGEMLMVLGCLRYILGTTAAMSPGVPPERNGRDEKVGDDPADQPINIDLG